MQLWCIAVTPPLHRNRVLESSNRPQSYQATINSDVGMSQSKDTFRHLTQIYITARKGLLMLLWERPLRFNFEFWKEYKFAHIMHHFPQDHKELYQRIVENMSILTSNEPTQ